MRTTFNISFVCRPSKVNRVGLAPIELSIIINGQRTYLALNRKESPSEFQKLYSSKKPNDLKDFLDATYRKVLSKQTEMIQRDIPVTAPALKEYIQYGCTDSYTVKQLFDDHYALLKKRVGVSLTKGVYRKYENVRDLFFKTISPAKQATEITNSVIASFYATLDQTYESTTSAAMMTKLKTTIIYALDNDRIQVNPFSGIKINKKTKPVEFLTEEEVNRIKAKKLHSDRLERVRDLFLFQCYTGLAYADMALLKKEDFLLNKMGQTYIKKNRQKTNVEFTTVLLPEAMAIVEKYDFDLPILSNQKYNSYLKEIADLCGITKPMHTHIGRHTAATFLLNKGLSIEVVAKILGHNDTRITRHYAKLLDSTVFESIQKSF